MRQFAHRSIAALGLLSLLQFSVIAQEKDQPKTQVVVKFKIFDANDPSKFLTPAKRAIVYARNPQTLKTFTLEEPPIKGPSKDGFYEVAIQKGYLVEQLEISIVDGDSDYSPAVLSKVITSADMLVYPGASKTTDKFSFQAYLAQMGVYRALLAQLIEDVDEQEKERRRTILREEFKVQLGRMSDVDARLLSNDPVEKEAAKKLAKEVLQLYGLMPPDAPMMADCDALVPPQPYMPRRRCCLFGWCR